MNKLVMSLMDDDQPAPDSQEREVENQLTLTQIINLLWRVPKHRRAGIVRAALAYFQENGDEKGTA